MGTLIGGIVALCFGVSLAMVARSDHARALAVGLVLGWSTFVPLVSASREIIIVFASAAAILVTVAELRSREPSSRGAAVPAILGLALICYMQLVRLVGGQAFLQEWVLTSVAILVIFLGGRAPRRDLPVVARTLTVFVLFHLVYALAELFGGLGPIWSMGNGLTGMGSRPNFLFPSLAGRPMTSFAHPIPLATFAVVVGIICFYLAVEVGRRWFFVGALCSVSLVLLSGTRSAVIAFGVALLVLCVFGRRAGILLRVTLLVICGWFVTAVFLNPQGLSIIGLGDGFSDSLSYTYRASVLTSAARIIDEPVWNVLFGWGANRQLIFDLGIVQGSEFGAVFFDNQFVAMAAMYGAVGLAIFVASFVYVALRSDVLTRSSLCAFFVMGFSFDFLQYLPLALLFYWALVVGVCDLTPSLLGTERRGVRAGSSAVTDNSRLRESRSSAKRIASSGRAGEVGWSRPVGQGRHP